MSTSRLILNLLLLEDDPSDAELTLLELRRAGFSPRWKQVETQEAYLAALDPSLDLILADYHLPHFDGRRALRLLREREIDVPFIIISGYIGEDVAVEMMHEGAADYLLKDRLARLGPAVQRALEQRRLREEARQAQRALIASERRFRALIEKSADAIALLDNDGIVRYGSPSTESILGYTLDEFIGRDYAGLIHPDERERWWRSLAELSSVPGATTNTLTRMLHRDGSWRWIESVSTNLSDEPNVQAIVSNYRDVTERVWAEEELRQSEQRFSTIFRASPVAIGIMTAPDGRFIDVNDTFLDQFGFRKSDVVGHTPDDLHMLPGSGDVERVTQMITDQSATHDLEIQYRTSEGSIRDALASVDQLQLEDQSYSLAVFHDITERKQLVRQTERHLQRLTGLRAIDTAISGSSDLRTMLSVLLGQLTGQLNVDAAAILALNSTTMMLEYAAARGFRTPRPGGLRVRLGEGTAGRAALERRLISANLVNTAEPSERRAIINNENFIAYFGVPLMVKGEVYGVLEVFHRAMLQPDNEWFEFLGTLAEQAAIAIDSATLFDKLQRSNLELTMAYDTTLEGWSRALDLRDKETEGHTLRVTELVMQLARAMRINDAELVHVRRGALLHDIGKMGIPDSILLKQGALTEDEWFIMRKHPVYAYEMLSPIAYLRPALSIPYHHHEKWDGTGYPLGLKGTQIPLPARIFSIIDVWDALRSNRPYRTAWPKDETIAYIRSLSGKHFDPKAAEVFLEIV